MNEEWKGVWEDKGRCGCCYTSASQLAMCTQIPSDLLNVGSGSGVLGGARESAS